MVAETFEFDSSAVDVDLIDLPEGDDFGIPSDEDDDAEVAAELQPPVSGFGNVIVVDNVPVVGPEKQVGVRLRELRPALGGVLNWH